MIKTKVALEEIVRMYEEYYAKDSFTHIVDKNIETVLELFERLLDFGHVLVLESLVHTQVVVAPAEVARSSRLDAC